MDSLENAKKRAEYWKAENAAANRPPELDTHVGVGVGARVSLSITEDAPVCKIRWAQGPCSDRTDQAYLEIGIEDEGSGAFFYLQSEKRFYFDSGDDLLRLADLVDALLQPFSDADVF